MKKILIVLLFTGMLLIGINRVSAAPIYDAYHMFGTFEIAWHDYDDELGHRPDEVTLKFTDLQSFDDYEFTFTEEDAEITRVDDETTIWSFKKLLNRDPYDGNRIVYTENAKIEHYFTPLGNSNAITDYDQTLTVDFYIQPYKTITYTEHWDDDNARDSDRYSALGMSGIDNNKYYRLSCGNEKDTYIDGNTCQKTIYIEDAYPYDENGAPQLDKPYKFEYKMVDYFINYEYDIKVDDSGNIDVYITHEPYRIDDSKVVINWNDDNDKNKKRPDELILELYNVDTKEQNITISKDEDWTKVITNLYKNYSHGEASDYSLKITNTKDYSFEVIGNNLDGFEINAKYIGEDMEDIVNPETNDNIILYVVILIISVIAILICGFFFLKKNKN